MTTTPPRPLRLSSTREAPASASGPWSRVLPATAAQVREARRFLADVLDGCPEADDAVLCLSELVTNATVHSDSRRPGGHVTVRATLNGCSLRVEVRDEGGPWTCPVRSRDGQHGRGLLLVAELTHDWGRRGDSMTGWTVWFTINLSTPPAATSPHPEGETTMIEPSPALTGVAHYDTQDMRVPRQPRSPPPPSRHSKPSPHPRQAPAPARPDRHCPAAGYCRRPGILRDLRAMAHQDITQLRGLTVGGGWRIVSDSYCGVVRRAVACAAGAVGGRCAGRENSLRGR